MLFNFKSNLMEEKQAAYLRQHPEEGLPNSFFKDLMNDQLGRGYLNRLPRAEDWKLGETKFFQDQYEWLRFSRLPIKPGKEEENTLLESWQSVLSACHTMNLRLAFVLNHRKDHTAIYLGATSSNHKKDDKAAEKLRQCMAIHMPGAEFTIPKRYNNYGVEYDEVLENIENYTHSGIVTGIPSLRNERGGITLQTLDKLAKGFSLNDKEKNYAMMVLADPAPDSEIVELIQKFLELKSEIHQFGGFNLNEGFTQGKNQSSGSSFNVGIIIEALTVASLVVGAPVVAAGVATLGNIFPMSGMGFFRSKGQSYSLNTGVTREYRDFIVKYCENLIDKNISRMERGRNLGFWQTGIYVLSYDNNTTDSVLGMLRSVYSGKESYLEPIRVFNTDYNDHVTKFIGRLQFLPLPEGEIPKKRASEELGMNQGWHVFGRMYENFTTAMTTEELSIATSLPRREVPGLRLVKNAVTFSNNSKINAKDDIEIGNLVDMGVVQQQKYHINCNALVRHILVSGITGSGKTTTCKKLIKGVQARNIPVMIIEPAKDDYVRWAIEQNKTLPDDKKYKIIMPGIERIDDIEPDGLYLNLLKPASFDNAPVNLVQHAEMMTTLLNAVLPSEDVIPLLIEETIHFALEQAASIFKVDIGNLDNPQLDLYPMIDEIAEAGEKIIERKTYENRIKEGYKEVLNTRFKYLSRGTRGQILNVPTSTNFELLFNNPVVINLSRLSGTKDKSLIMSLLLLNLQEYRMSRYQYDETYRLRAQKNELMHLLVLEEAHNVLIKPVALSTGNPQQAAAELFGNMLSEIRSYGQGMMIIDQVPTRLIEDAIKNTNYKIAHRMIAPDDVALMSSAMLLRPDQTEIIPALDIGNAIICGDMDDMASWVKIN